MWRYGWNCTVQLVNTAMKLTNPSVAIVSKSYWLLLSKLRWMNFPLYSFMISSWFRLLFHCRNSKFYFARQSKFKNSIHFTLDATNKKLIFIFSLSSITTNSSQYINIVKYYINWIAFHIVLKMNYAHF